MTADSNDHLKTSDNGISAKKQKPSFFSSTWLLAGAVIITFLLNIFCIVKVMTLEIERNQLESEKLLLNERADTFKADMALHLEILEALPELKTKQAELQSYISSTTGNLNDLVQQETALIKQIEKRENELNMAVSDRKQAESAASAARKEAGRLQSEIAAMEKTYADLGLAVARLEQDAVRQKSVMENTQTAVQNLKTEIQALTSTKEKRIAEIEQLTRDNKRLAKVNDDLNQMVKTMEESINRADTIINSLKNTAESGQKTVTSLEQHSRTTEKTLESLIFSKDGFSDVLEKIDQNTKQFETGLANAATLTENVRLMDTHARKMTDLLKTIGTSEDDFKTATQKVITSRESFDQEITLIKENRTQLEKDVDILTSDIEQIKSSAASLTASAEKLPETVKNLDSDQTRIRETLSSFQNIQITVENQWQQLIKQLNDLTQVLDGKVAVYAEHIEKTGSLSDDQLKNSKELAAANQKIQQIAGQILTSQNSLNDSTATLFQLSENMKQTVASASEDAKIMKSEVREISDSGQTIHENTLTLDRYLGSLDTVIKKLINLEQHLPNNTEETPGSGFDTVHSDKKE